MAVELLLTSMCAASDRPSESSLVEVGNAAHMVFTGLSVPKNQPPEEGDQEQMKNSEVERKGTVLRRSVDRQNTNPALPFAAVTIPIPIFEISTHSTATSPSTRYTNPLASLASVPIRPLAVPVMSSPQPQLLDAIVSPLRLRGGNAAGACRLRGDRREPGYEPRLYDLFCAGAF